MRAVAVLIAAATVAGCGVNERREPTAWVRGADAVCTRYVGEFRAIEPFTNEAVEENQDHDLSVGTFVELDRWAGDFLAVGRRVESGLAALGTPPDRDERRWLELNAENGAALAAVRAAAERCDEQAVYAGFERQGGGSEGFIELSRELGFDTCATAVSD